MWPLVARKIFPQKIANVYSDFIYSLRPYILLHASINDILVLI